MSRPPSYRPSVRLYMDVPKGCDPSTIEFTTSAFSRTSHSPPLDGYVRLSFVVEMPWTIEDLGDTRAEVVAEGEP